jgi:hypothetical protein
MIELLDRPETSCEITDQDLNESLNQRIAELEFQGSMLPNFGINNLKKDRIGIEGSTIPMPQDPDNTPTLPIERPDTIEMPTPPPTTN